MENSVVVQTDAGRRLMQVFFRGIVTPVQTARQIAQVENELPRLGRGFVLVTDLSGLESMDLDCVVHVTRMMDLCLAAGVGKVVRIIPDPDKDIGFNLLSLVHYRGRVPTVTRATRSEAEQELPAG